jgi:predicted HicB family RNase H-like nuclease
MVHQDVERLTSSGWDDIFHGLPHGLSVATVPPREAVDRIRRLLEKALSVLGHATPADPLRVPASTALKGQLRREAADRGMSLAEWAVMKLESGPLRSPASPSAYMPVANRWRTRC